MTAGKHTLTHTMMWQICEHLEDKMDFVCWFPSSFIFKQRERTERAIPWRYWNIYTWLAVRRREKKSAIQFFLLSTAMKQSYAGTKSITRLWRKNSDIYTLVHVTYISALMSHSVNTSLYLVQ